MTHIKSTMALALATTMLTGLATPAFAQNNGSDSAQNDEIIVTATRRAESIQDVPIAVTAVMPEELNRQGVVNIQNLGSVAPSFATSNAQIASGSVVLRIRGVGTTSNNIGFESAVGIFIDGAYQSRPGVALGEFVDVERVEVLRGPQGTLFGRNTSAGALNITNVRPDLDELGGFLNATYGNYNHTSLQGAVNIPLAEGKVAARITGALRNRDGYIDIQDANGTKIGEANDTDQYYLRGQIGFQGENNWKGRVIVDHSSSENICCPPIEILQSPVETAGVFGLVGLGPRGGMSAPVVAVSGTDTSTAQQAIDNLIATSSQVPNPSSQQTGVTAEVEYALTDNADAIYIGSYRDYTATEQYDSAFSGLDLFNVLGASGDGTEITTMTHELRIQGDAMDGRLSWLIGGYYSDEDIAQRTTFGLGTDYSAFSDALLIGGTAGTPLAPLVGGLVAAGGVLPVVSGGQNPANARTVNRYTQNSESFSVFTHNVFDVTDALSLTVGLRYSDESKDGSFSQPSVSYDSCTGQLAGFNTTVPGGFANAHPALNANLAVLGCFPFLAPADHPLSAVLPLPRTYEGTFKDDELIYTGKIGYEISPVISTYASFTHGYKSGGFNLDSTAAIGGADPQFASEEVDAYELGMKSKLMDGRITFNVAAFLEEFSNFQVLEFTGAQFTTFNVPKAETKGIELEASGRITDNLSFNSGLTLLNAKYPDDCAGTSTFINVTSLCGNTLTNAPKTVGLLGATYEGDLSNNFTFFLNGQLRYESDRRTSTQAVVLATQAPNPFDIQEATTKINLRAGIGDADALWSIEAWATNITNEITRGVTINTTLRSGSRSAFVQEPRMYGITARRNF